MKKLLVLIVLAAGLTGGVGYERGWFHVSSTANPNADGQDTTSVTVDVDKGKIRDDKAKVVEKVQQAKEKVADAVERHTSGSK